MTEQKASPALSIAPRRYMAALLRRQGRACGRKTDASHTTLIKRSTLMWSPALNCS